MRLEANGIVKVTVGYGSVDLACPDDDLPLHQWEWKGGPLILIDEFQAVTHGLRIPNRGLMSVGPFVVWVLGFRDWDWAAAYAVDANSWSGWWISARWPAAKWLDCQYRMAVWRLSRWGLADHTINALPSWRDVYALRWLTKTVQGS